MSTKSDITQKITDNILDGGRRTTASKTREVLDLMNSGYATVDASQRSGVDVIFTEDAIYGEPSAPETGDIIADLDSSKIGVVITIIHNDGQEPSYPAEFSKLSNSSMYVPGAVNYIFCMCVAGDKIIFSVATI